MESEFPILTSLIILLAATALMVHFFTRYKKLTATNNLLLQKIEQWQHDWQKEKQNLQADIDSKKSELSSLSIHYIHKLEHMNNLKENLEELQLLIPRTLAPKFAHIMETLSTFELLDKDWENFRTYFNDVNDGFFDHLKSNYPMLSAKDLKLCALMRMNLGTKQIATIMGVTPESTKVTRHRIRKKLGLRGPESLQQFLHGIAEFH